MKFFVRLLTVILPLALLSFTACAPVEAPPQDPTKEQITLLQKQLLELQKIQNDMKVKMEESSPGNIEAIEGRLKKLEEQQHVRVVAEPMPSDDKKLESEKKPVPVKKKPKKKAKKKKKAVKKQPVKKQPAESPKPTPQPVPAKPQAGTPQPASKPQPIAPQQPAGAPR